MDEVEEAFAISDIGKTVLNPAVDIALLIQDGQLMAHMVSEVEVYGKPFLGQFTSSDIPINDLFVGNDTSIRYIAFFKITTQNHLVESQGFNALSPMQATMKMLLVQL